jgi:alpha-beta hydrolase superfamily lysophospholipase
MLGPGAYHKRFRQLRVLSALAAAGVVIGACSSNPAPAGVPDGLPAAPTTHQDTAFTSPGPYRAGVAYETTSKGDTVVVYYPVDPDKTAGKPTYTINLLRWFAGSPTATLPPALQSLPTTLATDAYMDVSVSTHGPFPVVMFSHGFGGYPEQSSFLTDHLATWGFVVVAPDHRSRDLKSVVSGTVGHGQSDVQDLRDALAFARQMNHTSGGLLSGKLDLTRVAALGHSAGGGAAITFAGDRAVRTYVGLAPASGTPPPAGKPAMVMQGSADTVVPESDTLKLYAKLGGPKRLVLIDGAGHNAFDDACTIGAAQGGLVAFIGKLPLPPSFKAIATDGCTAPDVVPPAPWPIIDHAVVAQLRWGLGIDSSPVGLDRGLDSAFSPVHASVRTTAG